MAGEEANGGPASELASSRPNGATRAADAEAVQQSNLESKPESKLESTQESKLESNLERNEHEPEHPDRTVATKNGLPKQAVQRQTSSGRDSVRNRVVSGEQKMMMVSITNNNNSKDAVIV